MVINDWISVSPDNGCGEKTVTITLGKNNTGSSRIYKIPVYFDDGSIKYITVNQPACGVTPPPSPSICEDALVWGTYNPATLNMETGKITINGSEYTPTVNGGDWALCSWTGGTITNLANFMWNEPSMKEYESINLSKLDTSQVVTMNSTFAYCRSLTTLDLSNFNTGKVRDLTGLFGGCWSLTSLDLSHFDTSNVEYMQGLFTECHSLTSLDLSGFNTEKVLNMSNMFNDCPKLTSLDLSGFNTINVGGWTDMFLGCIRLTTVKVINCNSATQQKILNRLKKDLPSYTWTLSNGIITRS